MLLIAIFAASGIGVCVANDRHNRTAEVTVGEYQVIYRVRTGAPLPNETTLAQLQANPAVLDITWSQPNPQGTVCDKLYFEWYHSDHWFSRFRQGRVVHNGTPYRADGDC